MKNPGISMNQMITFITNLVVGYVASKPLSYIKEAVMEDGNSRAKTFHAYFLLGAMKSPQMYEVSFEVEGNTAVMQSVIYPNGIKRKAAVLRKEYHVIFPSEPAKWPDSLCFIPKHLPWDGVENGTDLYYEQARKKQRERLIKRQRKAAELVSLLQQKRMGGAL